MFFRVFLLICVVCVGSLSARFEDHLKKISDKGDFHKMRNINFIYMINLDERPEKFESCMRQLRPYGIYPYRFSAINGWKLPLEVINDLGVKFVPGMKSGLMATCYLRENNGDPTHEIMSVPGRTYFSHEIRKGSIGCALSHLSILQDALDAGYETIWIMEDDIAVLQNPYLVSDRIDELDAALGKEGWDLFFTDQDTISNETGGYVGCWSAAQRPNFSPYNPARFAVRSDIGTNFRKVGARYGTYSWIVRRSGIKKILSFVKKYSLFLPIDLEMILPNDIRLVTVTKDIVSTQRNASTDNRVPGFLLMKQILSSKIAQGE